MGETAKAREHRIRDGWFEKYAPADKPGIDIGCHDDKIHDQFRGWDKNDGDATFMEGVPDNSLHTVYASHLLEHLDQPQVALRNWWRILEPGGHLIVIVPHRDLYEKKKTLPSNWAPEHKTYWVPENNENEFTFGLKQFVTEAIPEGEVVEFTVLANGFRSDSDVTHSHGEYGIEIILRKPHVIAIDLPSTTTVVMTMEDNTERRTQVETMLKELAFQKIEWKVGKKSDQGTLYWHEVKKDVREVLSTQTCPFLFLEDDATVLPNYRPNIQIPADADIVYLGGTVYAEPYPMGPSLVQNLGVVYAEHDEMYVRPFNMQSSHAILFINPAAKQAYLDSLSHDVAPDACFAKEMKNWKVYLVKKPFWYQKDGHHDHWTQNYYLDQTSTQTPGGVC